MSFSLVLDEPKTVRQRNEHTRSKHGQHHGRSHVGARIAAVLAVARAVLHEDVERPGAHQTEALVALDARLAHERTAAKVAPFASH